MSFIKDIINKLDEYFSADETIRIKKLETELVAANDTITLKNSEIENLDKTIEEKESIITSYETKINELNEQISSNSNTRFVNAKKIFNTTSVKYTWRPNEKVYLHTTLNLFSADTECISKYWDFLKSLGVKESYDDEDSAVYDIFVKAQKYINNTLPDDYQTDKEVFGVNEYWITPQEAYTQYVTNKTADDCDGTRSFLYGCIVSGLTSLGFSGFSDRIKCVDIDFPEGHALFTWLKSDGTWAGIETTYGEARFAKNWERDKDIFRGIYTGIWHIFNEEHEYELDYTKTNY